METPIQEILITTGLVVSGLWCLYQMGCIKAASRADDAARKILEEGESKQSAEKAVANLRQLHLHTKHDGLLKTQAPLVLNTEVIAYKHPALDKVEK